MITCPSDAIKFANTFENSLFTRSKLIEQLNRDGSKLREKKKEPKPVVDKPVAKAEVAVDSAAPVTAPSAPVQEVKEDKE